MLNIEWKELNELAKQEYKKLSIRHNFPANYNHDTKILKGRTGYIIYREVPLFVIINKIRIKKKDKEEIECHIDLRYFENDFSFYVDNKLNGYHGEITLKIFKELLNRLRVEKDNFINSLEKKARDDIEKDGIKGLTRLLNLKENKT